MYYILFYNIIAFRVQVQLRANIMVRISERFWKVRIEREEGGGGGGSPTVIQYFTLVTDEW